VLLGHTALLLARPSHGLFLKQMGKIMKRTLATLGVVGLGLISLTAPALAAGDKVIVCHSDGSTWKPLAFSINALDGHDKHPLDIIPPTSTSEGKNWTAAGKELYAAQCAPLPPGEVTDPPVVVDPPVTPPVTPPAEQPPVVVDPPATVPATPPAEQPTVVDQTVVQPPVNQSVVNPPAAAPAQPAPAKQAVAAPQAAPKAAPAQVPAAVGTNQGYNAQTAVGASDGGPGWLAGVGALAAAGAAVAARRRSRLLNNAG
jgi:hypothetical protein